MASGGFFSGLWSTAKGIYNYVSGSAKSAAKYMKKKLGLKDSPSRVLLIGETGSGKTSFLNLLYNCNTIQTLGCGFGREGLQQFQQYNDIKLENAQAHAMESKTSDAKLYRIQLMDLELQIIDTPGFGDSRGLKQDEANAKRIVDCLKNEDYINCVCLIINGRQARMSASLKYVLTEITAILPKQILDNVIVVFSNTNNALNLNFDPSSLKTFFGSEPTNIFCIDNPYSQLEKAKTEQRMSAELIAKSLQKSFEDVVNELDKIYTAIESFPQVNTLHFIALYEKKKEIEGNVLRCLTEYRNQVRLEEKIKEEEVKVRTAVQLKTLNANFTTTSVIIRWVVDKTVGHNTLCSFADCHSNCHPNCTLPKSLDKEIFRRCACMADSETRDICKECGHSYTFHHHEEALFRKESSIKQFVDKEMQAEFKKATSDKERAQLLQKEFEKDTRASKIEKERLSRELLKNIAEFETLGIARNYIQLIENQLAVVETHLKGSVGSESDGLRKVKDEMEKKIKMVKDAKSSLTRP